MKLLHAGKSLWLESASLGLGSSRNVCHTELITERLLFPTAAAVLLQARRGGTGVGTGTLRHEMTWRQNSLGPGDQTVLVVPSALLPAAG